jgi:hypothetical protein
MTTPRRPSLSLSLLATIFATALLAVLPTAVSAHGFLKNIQVNNNGKLYPAWQVGQDDFVKPAPVRYARRLKDQGPVPDFTTKDITYDLIALASSRPLLHE